MSQDGVVQCSPALPGVQGLREDQRMRLLRGEVIGMIGVANKPGGCGPEDERLLSTFAAQVAVAVRNARLYESQSRMIAELQELHQRLTEAERAQLLGRERERIAGALHDRIEQQIFSIAAVRESRRTRRFTASQRR
jgi:GAF domain-containing protein